MMVIEVVTAPEVDAVEEPLHVRERRDADPALAHLALRTGVVGVAEAAVTPTQLSGRTLVRVGRRASEPHTVHVVHMGMT